MSGVRGKSTAEGLVRLYPRAWRARYGEEFLATAGPGELHLQLVIDIVLGAIDAWLSTEARNATRAYRVATNGGGLPMLKSILVCNRTGSRFTKRGSLIGAGVMIGATFLFSVLGIVLRHAGWPVTGEILKSIAFPGSLMVSMPFWLMKGQPWKTQAVIVGSSLAMLVAVSYLATMI
jgi:hypothetical protein